MKKPFLIITSTIIITVIGVILMTGNKTTTTEHTVAVNNTEIRDGVQYVTITAGGGYSPKVSTAKAGIPTKLIMKTNGSFDCSLSLVIRSVGFQKILPQTGETEIDIGTPKLGEPLRGVCGMGMYSFIVNFS